MSAASVIAALGREASASDATFLQRFFRTGPGEYGAGDVFIGVRVPAIRKVAKANLDLGLADVQKLLDSEVHEHRLAGLTVLTYQYPTATEAMQSKIHQLYIKNVRRGRVNNWDLVDSSAAPLVGAYLMNRPRDLLFALAKSDNLWCRRVAIVATLALLRAGDAETTLALAEELRHDPHDLMHKAVGWLLREVGKRVDRDKLRSFLRAYAHEMPRTMLRYAIEHLPAEERERFMGEKARRAAPPARKTGEKKTAVKKPARKKKASARRS